MRDNEHHRRKVDADNDKQREQLRICYWLWFCFVAPFYIVLKGNNSHLRYLNESIVFITNNWTRPRITIAVTRFWWRQKTTLLPCGASVTWLLYNFKIDESRESSVVCCKHRSIFSEARVNLQNENELLIFEWIFFVYI